MSNLLTLKRIGAGLVACCLWFFPATVQAQTDLAKQIVGVAKYKPGIWIDPDGCEHWVMDDGAEGFMSPHLTPDGKPVCRHRSTCAVLANDVLFATDSSVVSASETHRLKEFFANSDARAVIISGHTDSRASDAYNERLSRDRALAVSKIAESAGMTVYAANGEGEKKPIASNSTAAGMAKNRRVEVICLH